MFKRGLFAIATVSLACSLGGCPFNFSEDGIFPVWEPNIFDEQPTPTGPFSIRERRVEVTDGADGSPFFVTIFEPTNAEGPRPAFIWVIGSNVQPYYHQSLHEILASWGYLVLVPESRPLRLTDLRYHRRNTDLAKQVFQLASNDAFEVDVDPDRIAVGGYSIGATMALFVAAEEPNVAGITLWAPTGSPFWTGVTPGDLFPRVTQPVLFLLAEFDNIEPAEGFPTDVRNQIASDEIVWEVIPQGLHLQFQQPTGADSITDPLSDLSRFEQQGIAIDATRVWLDDLFEITRE